jgi:hypothetical protein
MALRRQDLRSDLDGADTAVWKIAQQVPSIAAVFYGVTPNDDEMADQHTIWPLRTIRFPHHGFRLKTKKQMGQKFTYYIYPAARGFVGGGLQQRLDTAALAGEVDPDAVAADQNAQRPCRAPQHGPARLALERTLAFLRN